MSGGDQLFRVRAAAVLKTRLIGVWPVERTTPERDRTSPILKIAMPLGIGNSLDHERSPFGCRSRFSMSKGPSLDGKSPQDTTSARNPPELCSIPPRISRTRRKGEGAAPLKPDDVECLRQPGRSREPGLHLANKTRTSLKRLD